MYKFIAIIFPFTLLACIQRAPVAFSNELAGISSSTAAEIRHIDSGYYFYFDELEHYRSDIGTYELDFEKPKTNLDSLKHKILDGNVPQSITDTAFIAKLKSIGFVRQEINPNKFAAVNDIFREKKSNGDIRSCIHIYRDLLVFRQNSRIVGISKICFSCHAYETYGTAKSKGDNWEDGDYARLHELLQL